MLQTFDLSVEEGMGEVSMLLPVSYKTISFANKFKCLAVLDQSRNEVHRPVIANSETTVVLESFWLYLKD